MYHDIDEFNQNPESFFDFHIDFKGRQIFYKNSPIDHWEAYHFICQGKFTVSDILFERNNVRMADKPEWVNGRPHRKFLVYA